MGPLGGESEIDAGDGHDRFWKNKGHSAIVNSVRLPRGGGRLGRIDAQQRGRVSKVKGTATWSGMYPPGRKRS